MSNNNAEKRAKFLETVTGLVCKDRNVQHGDAEDNFRDIATLWTDYLAMRPNGPLQSYEVGIMMTLFKIARMAHNPTNQENWLDAAGYMACGGVIAEGIKEPQVKESLSKEFFIQGIGLVTEAEYNKFQARHDFNPC